MTFDPIASTTVTVTEDREPRFVHTAQDEAAEARLADYRARHGRSPNVLFVLMDDVGWGDFGCYGGGIAVSPSCCSIPDATGTSALRSRASSSSSCS